MTERNPAVEFRSAMIPIERLKWLESRGAPTGGLSLLELSFPRIAEVLETKLLYLCLMIKLDLLFVVRRFQSVLS